MNLNHFSFEGLNFEDLMKVKGGGMPNTPKCPEGSNGTVVCPNAGNGICTVQGSGCTGENSGIHL